MSRLENLQDAIAHQNRKGGIPSDKWMVFLLTDIALSLATITDFCLNCGAEMEEKG